MPTPWTWKHRMEYEMVDVYPTTSGTPDVYPTTSGTPDVYSTTSGTPDMYPSTSGTPDVYPATSRTRDVHSGLDICLLSVCWWYCWVISCPFFVLLLVRVVQCRRLFPILHSSVLLCISESIIWKVLISVLWISWLTLFSLVFPLSDFVPGWCRHPIILLYSSASMVLLKLCIFISDSPRRILKLFFSVIRKFGYQ